VNYIEEHQLMINYYTQIENDEAPSLTLHTVVMPVVLNCFIRFAINKYHFLWILLMNVKEILWTLQLFQY